MGDDIGAFDLGQTSGWAIISKYRPPVTGTIRLAKEAKEGQYGPRWNELEDRLVEHIREHTTIGEIWYEAPFLRMGPDSSEAAVMVVVGYAVCLEKAAARTARPCFLANQGKVRKQVLGKGHFGNSEATKRAVRGWAMHHGLPDENEHVADALAVGEYAANTQGWSIFQTQWYGRLGQAAEE